MNPWQRELARAITDPAELLTLLGLDTSLLAGAQAAGRQFALRVPRGFVARMRPGDPHDPLLRQVLPLDAECQEVAGFGMDPVGDLASRAGTGLLHKYSGRALLITTGACAIHCRYCFRRHFPYAEQNAASGGWEQTLESLRADTSIRELILSGGDPLSLSTRRLTQLTQGLPAAPHIQRLRLHSRYPIVLPERIDAGLIEWLVNLPLQKVMVIHANHANELDDNVAQACRKLARAGVTLLNQSVILAGVNDDAIALAALSERLFAMQVLPYYLHVLDRVQGAAHFDVPESRAVQLVQTLMSTLPGYLVPRLVREIPGAPSKVPVRFEGMSARALD
jgi:EF-P beta-lysylation protein EpmB